MTSAPPVVWLHTLRASVASPPTCQIILLQWVIMELPYMEYECFIGVYNLVLRMLHMV